jgi:integrase/recombinase XerD
MPRRAKPGHSHRLTPRRLPGGSLMAVAVNEYLDAIEVQGYSPYTVTYRSRSLGYLVAWLRERGIERPGEVTAAVLERYQRSLHYHRKPDGAPLSLPTQAGYLTAVKGLFRWLAKTNRTLLNPAAELVPPRVERRLPKAILAHAEVEQVLAIPHLADPVGLRDRAIMEVLYSTGIRRSELCRLHVPDVDPARGTVMVEQGKGRRDRVIPIGERAIAWVERYLADARPRLASDPDLGILFLTVAGDDLTPDHLTERIGRYIRAGTGKRGSCHALRHTMATLMLDGGADIRHIQEMLGHAGLQTTEIYTHVSLRNLKAVHQATHPAANNTPRRQRHAPGDDPADQTIPNNDDDNNNDDDDTRFPS